MRLIEITKIELLLKSLDKDHLYKTLLNTNTLDLRNINLDKYQWFLILNESDKPMGIFVVDQFNANVIGFHFGLYKEYRNKDTVRIVRECFNILFSKIDCILIACIPSTNIPAIKGIQKLGFIHKTTIPGGFITSDMLLYSEV